jgi:hypothetical protein
MTVHRFSFVFFVSVNDNAPVFEQVVYQRSIAENERIDSILVHIHAYDRDNDVNSQLSYFIDDPSMTFVMNQQTGDISLKKSLDYETRRSYSIPLTGKTRSSIE